uniref:DUF7774 domain-containing protein n=1 Tax=Setaria digitata TaxID=48799 RepID=A0A915PNY6_9BILA
MRTERNIKSSSTKSKLLSAKKLNEPSSSSQAILRRRSPKSSVKAKKVIRNSSTSSTVHPKGSWKESSSVMSLEMAPVTITTTKKCELKDNKREKKSSGVGSKDSMKKGVKFESSIKNKVKENPERKKSRQDKKKKGKEKKGKFVSCEKLKIPQKKIIALQSSKEKGNINDEKKMEEMGYEEKKRQVEKKPGEKKLDKNVTDESANMKTDGISGNNKEKDKSEITDEQKPKVSNTDLKKMKLPMASERYTVKCNGKSPVEVAPLPASISSEGFPQNALDINSLIKSIEITKKDQLLYEKMDDHIILDTNLLQSLATDLTMKSNKVNKDIIGEEIAEKLIEIEKKDQPTTDQCQIKEEKEIAVSEIARKIVEALTSTQVLGKVLTPEEAIILRDYFSRRISLSEEVLATLDTALDKILRRAHEFYDDGKKLDSFLKDRDAAKAKLLDALIAKKSNYLVDLMSDASYYADRISKGLIDVYKLATEGILVARENFQYMQAAVGHTYRYSKDMAYRGAALTYETAARGRELAEIGASIGAQVTYDAAKMTIDAAIRGKELAGRGAAIGTKITSDAAEVTCDVTNRGKELAELGVAIGAKMTQDAASKGLQIAEGTIQAASKGTEMIRSSLTAASNITLDLSETALESAVHTSEMIDKKVQNLTDTMDQAKSKIQKSSEWFLSLFQPTVITKTRREFLGIGPSEVEGNDNDGLSDDNDNNGKYSPPEEKSEEENE